MSSELLKTEVTRWIKSKGRSLGFFDVKIARAEFMTEEARRLQKWLYEGRHGDMTYMENHFDKRVDPTRLVPGAKSVIMLGYNYLPKKLQKPDSPKFARYAYGKDYHRVLKKKLKRLFTDLRESYGDVDGRYYVDSAPVLERDWARRAGLGWVGKNTLLLNRYQGSYFFLATLITDIELDYDQPIDDYCGTCRRCIDACPTDAIDDQGYLMDGSKCISYLTIELKDEIPASFEGKMQDWIFGCDICQEVCPWNRFATPHDEPSFDPHPEFLEMSREQWKDIDKPLFDKIFSGSAVKRTKYSGLKRNLDFVLRDEI